MFEIRSFRNLALPSPRSKPSLIVYFDFRVHRRRPITSEDMGDGQLICATARTIRFVHDSRQCLILQRV